MDGEKTKEYILKWQSYDGGFGMIPGSESHGGGTYCAVASLHLMGFIEHDVQSKSAASSISGIPLYGAYRGKQLRVDSKGELTSLVTLYILVCVRTPPRRSRRKRLFICALTRAACLYRVGAVLRFSGGSKLIVCCESFVQIFAHLSI
uniref:Prenyltransferase alpha-alpha toroid domain-containing protein n=1 Tax=Populus alba TaxID=43335 RepID=A0A4U5QZL0_POPAL|nr:hypothetical protein D5086_0000016440 [Populus alba]